MSNSDLPVGNPESFIGECASMDLGALKDKMFMVAINSGERGAGKYICETAHGPYNFLEMCDEVAHMWKQYQHHAKVCVLYKENDRATEWLDECTVDYIEAQHSSIVTEAFLEGAMDTAYDCRAGLLSTADEDPRLAAKPEESADEA